MALDMAVAMPPPRTLHDEALRLEQLVRPMASLAVRVTLRELLEQRDGLAEELLAKLWMLWSAAAGVEYTSLTSRMLLSVSDSSLRRLVVALWALDRAELLVREFLTAMSETDHLQLFAAARCIQSRAPRDIGVEHWQPVLGWFLACGVGDVFGEAYDADRDAKRRRLCEPCDVASRLCRMLRGA